MRRTKLSPSSECPELLRAGCEHPPRFASIESIDAPDEKQGRVPRVR